MVELEQGNSALDTRDTIKTQENQTLAPISGCQRRVSKSLAAPVLSQIYAGMETLSHMQ
jgi:hypothetical protein